MVGEPPLRALSGSCDPSNPAPDAAANGTARVPRSSALLSFCRLADRREARGDNTNDLDDSPRHPVPPQAASPLGRRFPAAAGSSLAGRRVVIPDDLAGAPALLLVAYRRGTQVDVDRWQTFASDRLPGLYRLEVPVIPNPIYRPLAGWIDGGMRGGVPRDLWDDVVTIYQDGTVVRGFLGDHGGLTTHAVLLDHEGVVRWFEAGGLSAEAGERLVEVCAAL